VKIGIISDTHMPKRAKVIPNSLKAGLSDVELIIHAGDWSEVFVVELLEQIAPVVGVRGNIDSDEIKEKFQDKLILDINGYKIGVVHGHIGKRNRKTHERAVDAFKDQQVDCIVFGHSHIPYQQMHGKILLYNPGSPTDKRFQKEYSYGILTLQDVIATIQHYTYQDKS
jgi:uncharacterized protein